jgi:antitoxin MazE
MFNYLVGMKARIIQIGNSRGVRIPKALLEQTHLTKDVQIEARAGEIVIRSARLPREGWEEEFRRMAERGDDQLFDEARRTSFDDAEWEW